MEPNTIGSTIASTTMTIITVEKIFLVFLSFRFSKTFTSFIHFILIPGNYPHPALSSGFFHVGI